MGLESGSQSSDCRGADWRWIAGLLYAGDAWHAMGKTRNSPFARWSGSIGQHVERCAWHVAGKHTIMLSRLAKIVQITLLG